MISVIDASGSTQTINTLPDLGVAAAASSLPIVGAEDAISGTISVANSNYATPTIATPTTNSSVEITTNGYNTVVIQVSGTFTATLQVQGTVDGTNWLTLGGSRLHTYTSTVTTSITSAGIYTADVTGISKIRVTSTTAAVTGTANIYLSIATTSGLPGVLGAVSTVSLISAASLNIPVVAVDVSSSAITSTTTTSAIVPATGCSYEVNIPVTALSGTNPTLDVVIQESDDSGTNWFDVYHFERITATGIYRSPKLPLMGNRVRYVQTISGTSPSFTRAINRLQSSDTAVPLRRYFDRTFNSTQNLNANSSSYTMGSPSKNIQLIVSAGTISGTAPTFKVQGSEDNTNWYDIPGLIVTAQNATTTHQTVSDIRAPFLRAVVTAAGASASLNYICLKVYG